MHPHEDGSVDADQMLERGEEKWAPVFLNNHATAQKREQGDVSVQHHHALDRRNERCAVCARIGSWEMRADGL